MNPDQSDLGPYCLQYQLPQNISKWENGRHTSWLARKGVKNDGWKVQVDLGPYCLQYQLPQNISKWENGQQKSWLAGKRVKNDGWKVQVYPGLQFQHTILGLFNTPIPHRPRIARIATNWLFSYSGGFVRFHYYFFLQSWWATSHSPFRYDVVTNIRLESRKNSLRLENNIRTCCTKVKESITNQLRIRGMQHELGTN